MEDRKDKKNTNTQCDSSSLIWSMAVWLIGWFARNAANVNRQTSVKTTPLSLFQLVCVCLSEWIWEREGERVKSCFSVFVFRCSYVCLCVCAQRTVRACWMVKDQHCMMLINTHSPTLRARWVEQSSVTRVCASVWPHCHDWDVVLIFWGLRLLLLLCWFQNHVILKSYSCCDRRWSGLTWTWTGLERFWSWMGSTLDELRLNCIFKYLDFTVRVHDVNQLEDTDR